MRSTPYVVLAVVLILLTAGCGPGNLQTKGRILKGGRPFTLPEGEYARVIFIPILDNGKLPQDTYVAEYDRQDGTFKVAGKDLSGMPPGKYKIMVEHIRKKNDVFKGQFAEDRTPFTCEVKTANDEVTIDLDTKK